MGPGPFAVRGVTSLQRGRGSRGMATVGSHRLDLVAVSGGGLEDADCRTRRVPQAEHSRPTCGMTRQSRPVVDAGALGLEVSRRRSIALAFAKGFPGLVILDISLHRLSGSLPDWGSVPKARLLV